MKRITIIIFILAGLGFSVKAQELKIGHINTQEVIYLMAEMDTVRMRLQVIQTDLIETMQGMEDEYQAKYTEYNRRQATWTAAVKEAKEKEIQDLIARLQQFQQTAQQELGQQEQELSAPVYQKAQIAINKVAKELSLTYVFNTAAGAIIYLDETASVDLLPLVKKELGIPEEKVTPTQLPQQQ